MLLKHYDKYLKGAKDPDAKFRDFQNHVLHVGDGNWGGAMRSCEKWLKTAVNHLNNEEWEDASYDLGVLSHYFTDPLMPLHTGSSDSEGVVHRSMEWSVCKSYDTIYQRWASGKVRVQFKIPSGDHWISESVLAGAEMAYAHYDRVIDIYDLKRGTRRPPEGLNAESLDIFAEMFGIAITGWARVLERVAEQASVRIPASQLHIATIVAAIDFPVVWVLKKIESAKERAAVRAIFKEYQSTGTVRVNQPPEVRTVRTELAMSVNRQKNSNSQSSPLTSVPEQTETKTAETFIASVTETPSSTSNSETASSAALDNLDSVAIASKEADEQTAFPERTPKSLAAAEIPKPAIEESSTDPSVAEVEPASEASDTSAAAELETETAVELPSTVEPERTLPFSIPSVSEASDLVDAPSIGPKTAERFAKINVHTIGEFLEANAAHMAEKLDVRWINADLVSDWQSQARLVCELGSLCGYKSQLLVAIDCRDSKTLASQQPEDLARRIANYGKTKSGERILRSSSIPDEQEVRTWIDDARRFCKRLAA